VPCPKILRKSALAKLLVENDYRSDFREISTVLVDARVRAVSHIHYLRGRCRRPMPCVQRCRWKFSVLQCVAVCCSVLQYVAVCCSMLQCVAVCCSVWQCVAPMYTAFKGAVTSRVCSNAGGNSVCCSALQCISVCCSVLQCVAVCCTRTHYLEGSTVIQCSMCSAEGENSQK